MANIRLHHHLCEVCFEKWEHGDSACFYDYRKFVKCETCLLREDKERVRAKAFAEWEASLPIPHTHRCPFCLYEWPHDDRQCAAREIIWLDCEPCSLSFHAIKSLQTKDESMEEDNNVFGPY